MTETQKIPSNLVEYLFELDNGEYTEDPDLPTGWQRIEEVEGDHGRWRQHMSLIVMDPGGNFWEIRYQWGLTENCDHSLPWRDAKEVTATRVWQKPVITHTWVTRNPEETT